MQQKEELEFFHAVVRIIYNPLRAERLDPPLLATYYQSLVSRTMGHWSIALAALLALFAATIAASFRGAASDDPVQFFFSLPTYAQVILGVVLLVDLIIVGWHGRKAAFPKSPT